MAPVFSLSVLAGNLNITWINLRVKSRQLRQFLENI